MLFQNLYPAFLMPLSPELLLSEYFCLSFRPQPWNPGYFSSLDSIKPTLPCTPTLHLMFCWATLGGNQCSSTRSPTQKVIDPHLIYCFLHCHLEIIIGPEFLYLFSKPIPWYNERVSGLFPRLLHIPLFTSLGETLTCLFSNLCPATTKAAFTVGGAWIRHGEGPGWVSTPVPKYGMGP